MFFSLSSAFSQRRKYRKTVDKFGIQVAAGLDASSRHEFKNHIHFEAGFYYNIPLSKKCTFTLNSIYNLSRDRIKNSFNEAPEPEIFGHRYKRITYSSKLKIPLQFKYILNRRSSIFMIIGYAPGFHFGMNQKWKHHETINYDYEIVDWEDAPDYEIQSYHEPITFIQDVRLLHRRMTEQFEFGFGFKIKDLYIEPSFKFIRTFYSFHHPIELRFRYSLIKVRKKSRKRTKK